MNATNEQTKIDMNAKQRKIVDQLIEAIKRNERVGPPIHFTTSAGEAASIQYEVKKLEVDTSDCYGKPLVFLMIEIGSVGDEGTLGSWFNRKKRHIMVSERGAIRLLNARTKRKSRGFWNAVHALRSRND